MNLKKSGCKLRANLPIEPLKRDLFCDDHTSVYAYQKSQGPIRITVTHCNLRRLNNRLSNPPARNDRIC